MGRFIRNRKLRGTGRGEGRGGILFGAAVELLVLTAAITATAYLFEKAVIPVGKTALIGKICFAAALFLGCWLGAGRAKKGKILQAAISGTILLLMTAAACALLCNTENMRLWTPFAITVGAILTGGMLGASRRAVGYR